MDIQRTLLIGAAFLLGYMLLTEWVAFKDERSTLATPESRLTAADSPATTARLGAADEPVAGPAVNSGELPSLQDAPDMPGAISASAEDLPSVPSASAEQNTSVTEASAASQRSSIVQVYTDSLQLAIDLRGGDIVEVALPRFLADSWTDSHGCSYCFSPPVDS